MGSEMRKAVGEMMNHYRRKLKPDNQGWKILEVGIDGDPKPGGNYKRFGIGNEYRTLDNLKSTEPDFVADICDTKMPSGKWDLVIFSQTIEHIFDFRAAINECFRLLKPSGYLIVDCPFVYPYHGTKEYDDYWRMSHKALGLLLAEAGFERGRSLMCNDILTTALVRKPK